MENSVYKLSVDHYVENFDAGIIELYCLTEGRTFQEEPNHIEKPIKMADLQAEYERQANNDQDGEPVTFNQWYYAMDYTDKLAILTMYINKTEKRTVVYGATVTAEKHREFLGALSPELLKTIVSPKQMRA